MTPFEKAVVEEIKRIRSILSEDERAYQFHFQINAAGRIHDGEVLITFGLGEYSPSVSANSVDECVYEWLRRNGFNKRHNGLVLSGRGEVENSDDLPF